MAHTYIVYIRDYRAGAKNALQIMSLAAFASKTNNYLMRVNGSTESLQCSKDMIKLVWTFVDTVVFFVPDGIKTPSR